MSSVRVRLHPEAVVEARAASDWYARQSARASQAFMEEIREIAMLIQAAPTRWPKYESATRKLQLKRFPYALIYQILNLEVIIVAVAHGHRRPEYWKHRLD